MSILLGNGDGTFQPARQFALSNTPQTLAVGDFNGDGNTDIAVVGASTLSVLLGNGDGTFQPAYSIGPGSNGLIVADFNGDGIADIAVGVPGSSSSKIAVMLGIGNGFFETAVDYAVGANATVMAGGDFNGDGIADIAVALNTAGTVGVLLGNGDGTFQPAVSYPAASGPQTIAVLDFNADGKPDLVTGSNSQSGNLSVLLGNGDGTFQPPLTFSVPNGTQTSIAVADFNGDGRIDVACDGSALVVLLGESLPPTTTTLAVPANTAYYNQPLTLTAMVSPASATGTVTFFDGAILLGTSSLTNGQAAISVSLVNLGVTLSAQFTAAMLRTR